MPFSLTFHKCSYRRIASKTTHLYGQTLPIYHQAVVQQTLQLIDEWFEVNGSVFRFLLSVKNACSHWQDVGSLMHVDENRPEAFGRTVEQRQSVDVDINRDRRVFCQIFEVHNAYSNKWQGLGASALHHLRPI